MIQKSSLNGLVYTLDYNFRDNLICHQTVISDSLAASDELLQTGSFTILN